MIAYVDRGLVKVGDRVVLELKKGRDTLCIVEDSHVTRVDPSKYHPDDWKMDEIEF